MTTWAWRTSDVPPSTAFMPMITKSAGMYQAYKDAVDGQPGTMAVPAPNNDIPSSPLLVTDHKSSDAPPVWYPQVWFQDRLPGLPFPAGGNDAGVRVHSDNQLPVPAVEPMRGTSRLGGGAMVPAYMKPRQQKRPRRRIMERHV